MTQKLTDEERLGIENIYLRLQNGQLQIQQLDVQKAQIIEGMRALQKEMEERRDALSKKYGVDISRTTVKPDGTIVEG